ncbi:hypothetical protein NDU88_005521 [Pleurodeles waltl]|uniref:Uncharacterized protein n=1 Tax=Pleurodeles waltl TaxID=8319 RepID=A0AAV7NMQ6_PLEWA|nr:hypothetical protein NDU88_005521 [Pleurodeles waltl]
MRVSTSDRVYKVTLQLEGDIERTIDAIFWDRLALILTLAGGGGRPPKSRRQVTVLRSKDRGGNSDFPAGLAGGRLQTASQPSGKEASTMKPARNRAGGVEAVRRVQLHPSRISLSAQQTVKYM